MKMKTILNLNKSNKTNQPEPFFVSAAHKKWFRLIVTLGL